MTYALVLILTYSSATASVSLPFYKSGNSCVEAGKIAEKNWNVMGWVCIPINK